LDFVGNAAPHKMRRSSDGEAANSDNRLLFFAELDGACDELRLRAAEARCLLSMIDSDAHASGLTQTHDRSSPEMNKLMTGYTKVQNPMIPNNGENASRMPAVMYSR
jgi:hypothetical protein